MTRLILLSGMLVSALVLMFVGRGRPTRAVGYLWWAAFVQTAALHMIERAVPDGAEGWGVWIEALETSIFLCMGTAAVAHVVGVWRRRRAGAAGNRD